jgi:signal transduction histidine kinase
MRDGNGKLLSLGDSLFDLSDEAELQKLYGRTLVLEKLEGTVEEYDLRFVRMETPWGPKLVFTDMSGERAMTRRVVNISILVGLGALMILAAGSLLLSGWAVKPVEDAWNQQKQFVTDASHELKTPLTVIISNAELLQQPGYSDEKRQCFSESILSMSRQMRHLVESLLNLARLDSTRDTDELHANLDFSALVEECILPFEPMYFERGLLLESEIEPGLQVCGNEVPLRRCVDILLDNAQKYSEPGTVRVRLCRDARQAVLTVTNPYPELSKRECRDVFKRFYRRDSARTDSGSYGLGLPIADTHSMRECVDACYRMAQPGNTVLLSPCCASFDLFKNMEDRGEQFKTLVRNL